MLECGCGVVGKGGIKRKEGYLRRKGRYFKDLQWDSQD